MVGVPVVQRDAERLRDIRSLVRNSARSHIRLVSATFRGWVMSRMAWWKIVREGARRMLAEALAAEVDVYIAATR